jgi:hypothetical protein
MKKLTTNRHVRNELIKAEFFLFATTAAKHITCEQLLYARKLKLKHKPINARATKIPGATFKMYQKDGESVGDSKKDDSVKAPKVVINIRSCIIANLKMLDLCALKL